MRCGAPTIAEGERVCSSVRAAQGQARRGGLLQRHGRDRLHGRRRARSASSIPGDLSVVGIDNIPFGRFTSPALTTVDTQSELLGEEGMRLLFRLIAGESPRPPAT